MSGELQTIPARHGVATFVPRGRTIKVINTYGKQVVSMWAFSLGAPPEEEDEAEHMDEEKVRQEADGLKNSNEADTSRPSDTDHPPQQARDTPETENTTESTAASSKQPARRTWGSYLPSIPYRNKGASKKDETEQKPSAQDEKTRNEANTKTWSSYLPTGKAFSSYIPNVQMPDSKSAVSAFKSSHYRDPNKSYAEQLYDFSKTPVGAGTIAAATGSGYASSVYAAYSAYASTHASRSSQPPMEYLSLPHTRAFSHKLVPDVDDRLLTNLRNPIVTLIEDTTPGAHDTLTAACDANLYTALGVEKPEEHGSCAENLVLALKELNETAGLQGAKAIGADITVNMAPTPLHLFMNAPLDTTGISSTDGAGAKGAVLGVDEPKGKKRSYVRFKADRDVVIVFSACPMDVGKQNGGRCMAANFLVEDVQEGEDLARSIANLGSNNKKKKKSAPRKLGTTTAAANNNNNKVDSTKQEKEKVEKDIEQPKKEAENPLDNINNNHDNDNGKGDGDVKPPEEKKQEDGTAPTKEEASLRQEQAMAKTEEDGSKPRKKPKKLEVRSR
ncbi:hypothetical protein ACEQ8H_003751 [Pleosporales sp. CAS-2024a]